MIARVAPVAGAASVNVTVQVTGLPPITESVERLSEACRRTVKRARNSPLRVDREVHADIMGVAIPHNKARILRQQRALAGKTADNGELCLRCEHGLGDLASPPNQMESETGFLA